MIFLEIFFVAGFYVVFLQHDSRILNQNSGLLLWGFSIPAEFFPVSMMKIKFLSVYILQVVVSILLSGFVYAQSNQGSTQSWTFAFDQPQTVWNLETTNVSIIKHVHLAQEGYRDKGCEYIKVNIPANAQSVMLGMKVGTGRLTDSVLPSIYVKSNRTELRFLLRVILPMSRENPRTDNTSKYTSELQAGNPVSLLLTGGTYSSSGRWQEIRIDRPLDILKKQVADLSRQLGRNLDITCAYFDMLYLDINGGEGETDVWIDELEIAGFEEIDSQQVLSQAQNQLDNPNGATRQLEPGIAPPFPQSVSPNSNLQDVATKPINGPDYMRGNDSSVPNGFDNPTNQFQVKISNDTILLNGEHFFVRAVRYNNEPLEFIRQLGFNTVWMNQVPSVAFQAQARNLGLWIVCPPPLTTEQKDVFSEDSYAKYSPTFWNGMYDRVLFWDIGTIDSQNLTIKQVEMLCSRICECDHAVGRPIVALAKSNLNNISRHVDIMLISRNPMYSSVPFSNYLRWLQNVPYLMMQGKTRICVIPTQPATELTTQWRVMFPNEMTPDVIPYEQMQFMAYAAAGTGNRGLLFESTKPLNAPDVETQYRCRYLTVLNARLSVVDSFLAIGSFKAFVKSLSDLNLWYVMINIQNRGRLLLPLYMPQDSQFVLSGRVDSDVALKVPDVPSSYRAYCLTSNGTFPIITDRPPGEIRLRMNFQVDSAMILLTRDNAVVSNLIIRLRNYGPIATSLNRELTINRFENFKPWYDKSQSSKEEKDLVDTIVSSLERAECAYQQHFWAKVDNACSDASNALRILEYSYWRSVAGGISDSVWHPAAVSFRTIRLLYQWKQKMQQYVLGDNMLPTGDFEFAKDLSSVGWTIHKDDSSYTYIQSGVQLCTQAAHRGSTGLLLSATMNVSQQLQNEIVLLDKSPISVSSPVVQVNPYETVKIVCHVKLPRELRCSVDGLIIRDSFSGDALAYRTTKTYGWKTVTLFRTADGNGNLQLTFELNGIGEAYIDSVKILRIVPKKEGEKSNVTEQSPDSNG